MARTEHDEATRNAVEDLALRARIDRAAFGELYDVYMPSVYSYCLRRLGEQAAAEDATAAVFMKALAAIGRYRREGPPFRAWLFTIAHHTVIDMVRAQRRTIPLTDEDSWDLAATGPGPEEIAVAAADLARLRMLLAELPADRAQMVELRLAGLTDREIAVVLGRSYGAIRVALHRALAHLRAALHPEDGAHD